MMVIFTHIAKSAGSSVKAGIKHNFQRPCYAECIRDQIKYPSLFKRIVKNIPISYHPDIISAHAPYGIHTLFKDTKYSYFTFLRHPITRWISCFYHPNSNPAYRKYKEGQGIRDVLEWCLRKYVNCNVMTRQLSGLDSPHKWILPNKMKYTGSIYYAGARSLKYSKEEMDHMLQAAKHNIKHCYSFVGFQENGYADMEALCYHYDWTFRKPSSFLKSTIKEHSDWSSEYVVSILEQMNEYDIELYKYARKIFAS